MHHWTIIDTTYLYDGTIEGLLTIVYQCFKKKVIPNHVFIESEYRHNLLERPTFIHTDFNQSLYVIEAIRRKISDLTMYYVFTAFLANDIHKSNTIIRYVVYAFKYGKNINFMKSLDYVIEIQRLCKNVKGEAHRFLGFIRFTELSNAFLYAQYESDHAILSFLAEHFSQRLSKEIWMIHDRKREQIALYNREKYVIVDATSLDISAVVKSKEDTYLVLWKEYFNSISIEERENRRCQRQFMPKKYWKYLPEV